MQQTHPAEDDMAYSQLPLIVLFVGSPWLLQWVYGMGDVRHVVLSIATGLVAASVGLVLIRRNMRLRSTIPTDWQRYKADT